MTDPYAPPQNLRFVKYLSYAWTGEKHSMLGWSLNQCTLVLFVLPNSDTGFQLTPQIWASKFGGNGVMTDPYAYPQYMEFVKHISYNRSTCENYSMLGWCLN